MSSADVLVADASASASETVSALETAGYEVTAVDSVAAAVAELDGPRPDAVVTEYRLADDDGIALLREVRANSPSVPVVVYTAHGDEQVASDCIEADVSAYVPKGSESARERLRDAVEEAVAAELPDTSAEELPQPTAQHIVRAVDEAPIGITLSDPSLPDNPMVYLNEGYEELTGYDAGEVFGRNCRFLQGPETAERPVERMREAIDAREPVSVELLNYREDGTPFWNRVTIAPIYDGGEVTHYVGFQEDVTERKEAEARAQQRAEALRDERQTLERVLGRVSGLVNDISHALVEASSREEIERRVCEEITATEGYSHAWIGGPRTTGTSLTVRASHGRGPQRIEPETTTDRSGQAFEEILETETVTVPPPAADMPEPVAPERFDADAMAVVPLTYRQATYGALCVYAERSGVLDRRECKVFDAIGQMVASGINAVETKQVLTGDRVTELGFEIADDAFPFVELATSSGASVSYDGSTVTEDGSLRLFVTVSDLPESVDLSLDSSDGSGQFVIARQEQTVAAAFEFDDDHPFVELTEYGATLRDLSVSSASGTAQLHLDLPVDGEVRSVLAVLEEAYGAVELVRQREREHEPRPTAAFASEIADRLTDRQYTALETAFLSDYFEFPRPVSGDELAESMGISRQTYHQHLRTAQQKLLEELFDSR